MAIIAPDIGIDLGTSNTLLHVKNKGIVIDEPTILVVSRNEKRGGMKALGNEAIASLGRTAGNLTAIRPVSGGVIQDLDMTQYMLNFFMKKAIGKSYLVKPRAVITVPCKTTMIERRAVRHAAIQAGIRPSQLHLIEKPFASAIGSGLSVFEPRGTMIVDIGGGTTEVAVISMGGIVVSHSILVGGNKMDEAIIAQVKSEFNMLIGDRTAESVKIDMGAALPLREERRVTIRGRDLISSLPQTAALSSVSVYEALKAPCMKILEAIHRVLEATPPELAGDILRSGIYLTGGGSLLFGLDQFIASELDMPVRLAREPMLSAAHGVGQLTDHFELLENIRRSNHTNDDKESDQ